MKASRLLLLALLTVAIGFGTIPLSATVIAYSTFDNNDEGWMNGEFTAITGSPTAVNWLASGGNPGGHIQVYDNYPWNSFYAPAKFLGNQSAAYLGTLTFDIYDSYLEPSGEQPAVMISDGSTYLFSPLVPRGLPYGPPFVNLSVVFQASAGWSTDPYGANPATEQQMQTVLANLQVLAIDADWHSYDDDVHLDNVYLNSPGVPEPATMLLLLGGVPVLLRRLRK